jgi:FMN reductase
MTSAVISTTTAGAANVGQGRPLIVGLGGTLRPYSSSELALRYALRAAEGAGADIELSTARELGLPMYDPAGPDLTEEAIRFVDAMRRADAVIISTPGYHGGVSGLIKNALDYLQELASQPRPYLHDKPVGCIVTAAGWQAGATTLTSLRSTVHALRGWPSPLGVVINSATPQFDETGETIDPKVGEQLATMAKQVVMFAGTASHSAR